MSDVTSDDGNHIWRKGRGWVPINEDAEMAKDALIRELVAALVHMLVQPAPDTDYARRIIAHAKAQGYEP